MRLTVLMENTGPETLAVEHGLSLYLEVCGKRILFDAGQSGHFADNAGRLGVDLSGVELAILSHGHYDHGDGMPRFLREHPGVPLYLHEAAFGGHYHGAERYIGLTPALQSYQELRFTGARTALAPGLTLLTCEEQEPVCPVDPCGLTRREGDVFLPEDFRHEQVLLIEENGRRIAVSGCSHKGIRNLMAWLRPDVFIGGFHLKDHDPGTPAGRAVLETVAAELSRYPTQYYTCHCTGGAQLAFLQSRMGDRVRALHTGDFLEV
ncbi:MAG: MBL fold metallo-hydrolase [Ruminococcaceae bacterium]|nr:MBL fold metallo-hydrolase [Oscillospiraceae bacterium]